MSDNMSIKDLQDIAENRADVQALEKRLDDTVADSDRRFGGISESLSSIRFDVNKIKDNHLDHLEKDMASVKTNVDWLMKFFWIIAGSSVGGLVTGVINLLGK